MEATTNNDITIPQLCHMYNNEGIWGISHFQSIKWLFLWAENGSLHPVDSSSCLQRWIPTAFSSYL